MNNLKQGAMSWNNRKYTFTVEAVDTLAFENVLINCNHERFRTEYEQPFDNKHVHTLEMTEDEWHELLIDLEEWQVSAFDVIQECLECEGDGTYEVGPECFKPASMCCGGCYKTHTCDACEGTGKITPERYY